jgi:transcriptional regulator with XRE-family HTH domain/DNA-binding CsgD family transcriptional regulator
MDDPPRWETLTGDPVEIDEEEPAPAFRIGAVHRLFHAELRAWRLLHGLTQQQLARKAGLPAQKIGALENFRVFPTEPERARLAELTGIPADRLFPPWLKEWATEAKVVTTEHEVGPAMLTSPEALALPAPDDDFEEADREADRPVMAAELARALSKLGPREQRTIELRFGLDGGGPRGLSEIGQILGVSREQVRQFEAEALRKLRHPSRSKPLARTLEALDPAMSRGRRVLYTDWLYDQQDRADQIGRHARDVFSRECCVGWSVAGLRSHVTRAHGVKPDPTIKEGAAEFERWQRRQANPPSTLPEPPAVPPPDGPPVRRLVFSERPKAAPKPKKPKKLPEPPAVVWEPPPPPPGVWVPPQPGGSLLMSVARPPRTREECRAETTDEQFAYWESLNALRRQMGVREIWG